MDHIPIPRPVVDELLTVDEVAAQLRVSKSWVYEHTRRRSTSQPTRLPHLKVGKYLRFDATQVKTYLKSLEVKP